MPRQKTKKLEKLEVIDGRNDSPEIGDIKTIDELLGVVAQNPFKSHSLEDFERRIDNEMNIADMQSLATRVGLLPIHDRTILKKRLIDEFKKTLKNRTPVSLIENNPQSFHDDKKLEAQALKTLKQGA